MSTPKRHKDPYANSRRINAERNEESIGVVVSAAMKELAAEGLSDFQIDAIHSRLESDLRRLLPRKDAP